MEKKNLKTVKTVNIKTEEENPMPFDLIAENIKKVADNFDKATRSGLTLKAICLLIQDSMTGKERLGIKDIENVLIYARNLRKYITK